MKRSLPAVSAVLALVCSLSLLTSCGTRERTTGVSSRELVSRPGANAYGDEPFVKGRAVVVLSTTPEKFFDAHPDLVEIASIRYGSDTYRLVESKSQMEGLDGFLEKEDGVDIAFPDREVWTADGHGESMGFDDGQGRRLGATNYREQGSLDLIRWDQSWQATHEKGGDGMKIAILDTGVDSTHPEWSKSPSTSIVPMGRYLFLVPDPAGVGVEETRNGRDDDGDGKADEAFGHGTHVIGIARLAAPAATFMIYKVLSEEGKGTAMGVALAIRDAVEHGADVVNLSLGLTGDDPLVRQAIKEACLEGVAVVASAGNLHVSAPQYPAAYPDVFAVTAIDEREVLADFANFGDYVDLSAPGVDVVSTYPHWAENEYATCSGGSMAVPFVSGTIALRMSAVGTRPARTAGFDVWWTATDIDKHNGDYRQMIGRGRIDLMSAVTLEK